MSDFVNKPGLGTMRANKFKDTDAKPDIKGEITLIGGEVVKFAGWKKTDKNGGTYYSLKVDKPREAEDAEAAFRAPPAAPVAGREDNGPAFDLDDEIPF